MRQANLAALNLIKSFEGLRLSPYKDAVGVPTIGIGTIKYPSGKSVSMSDPAITEDEALDYLHNDLKSAAQDVERLVTVPINDNQFGALCSFVYNLGAGALEHSTLLKLLNSGDVSGAAEQFLRWDHAGGKVLAGLTRRRQAERALFLHPV
jgi:lysozyme